MGLIPRNLTGTIKKIDGTNWAGAELIIAPARLIVGDGLTVPEQEIVVTTDENGQFTKQLYTLEDSYISYSIKFPSGVVKLFEHPDGEGDANLDELLAAQLLNDTETQIIVNYLNQLIDERLEDLEIAASGPASGVLSGHYPSPGFAENMAYQAELDNAVDALDEAKQARLISGTNIKTINGVSVLGAGNIEIEGGSGSTDAFTAQVDVKDYGASGSAARYVGVVSAGSLNQVALSTSEHDFEVGQDICIKKAGLQTNVTLATSDQFHIATITEIDGAVITYDPPAVRAVTSAADNVQHDDTRAINDAIRGLFDLGHGGGVVKMSADFYRCNKGFSDEQTDGATKVNAIIYPPFFASADYPLQRLVLQGEFRTGTIWGESRPVYGTILQTEINGIENLNAGLLQPSFIASRGLTSTTPYNLGFNYIEMIVRDMHIRCSDNPTITAVNLANAVNGSTINVSCETESHPNDLAAVPTNNSTAFYLPRVSNAARVVLKQSHGVGFKVGCIFSEHTVFEGDVYFYHCDTALFAEGGGYPNTGKISVEHCLRVIRFNERNVVNIEVNVERAQLGVWNTGASDVSTFSIYAQDYDADRAHGVIRYVISAAASNPFENDTVQLTTDHTNADFLLKHNLIFPNQAQTHGTVDNTSPTAALTAPANGATVSGANVTVSANASDNVGVQEVEFFRDATSIGVDTTGSGGSYSVIWNTTGVSNGAYVLTAVARDGAGNETTSASRTVTVDNTSGGGGAGYAGDIHDLFSGTPGASIHGRVPDTVSNGNTWQVVEGAFLINQPGGSSYAAGDSVNVSRAVIEMGSADVIISAVVGLPVGGGAGVLFRHSDANNFFNCFFSGSDIQIYKCEAGSFSTVGASAAHTLAGGDALEVRTSGNNIEVWVNGAQKITTSSTFNNTATKHGIRSGNAVQFDECQIVEN